ncbi:STM4015 family protein [soil metagenome]
MINEHDSEWLGYPIKAYSPEDGTPDYKNTIYRIAVDWDSKATLADLVTSFLADPASSEVPAISVGTFGESDSDPIPVVEALAAAHSRLPNLRGLFIGDIIGEENEISWIQQADLSPLFKAFPLLTHFRTRGGNGLSLGRIDHQNLKSLIVEAGGLPRNVVQEILSSNLPSLEHLEIWTGTDNYGWDGTIKDFEPLFATPIFPQLKYLGLRNSEIADELAVALAGNSAFPVLETLDFSLGTLTDVGAEHLLSSPVVKQLKHLDLHYHFLSQEMMDLFAKTFPSARLDDRQESEEDGGEAYRYVAVSE